MGDYCSEQRDLKRPEDLLDAMHEREPLFATTGDSRWIVVDEDRRVVGMVVAVDRETEDEEVVVILLPRDQIPGREACRTLAYMVRFLRTPTACRRRWASAAGRAACTASVFQPLRTEPSGN